MTHIFNPITGMLLVISFPIKATLQILHIKSCKGEEKSLSSYMFAFPIIDNHKSIYKTIVNFIVIYQYLIILFFNWKVGFVVRSVEINKFEDNKMNPFVDL